MPHYEVVFEDGSHSIAFYEDDAEADAALAAHHERAKNGQSAKAESTARNDVNFPDPDRPAVRIVKALKYDHHPADYGVGQTQTASDVKKAVADAVTAHETDGSVAIHEVAAVVRDMNTPLVSEVSHPHDSHFKMEETGEAELTFLKGDK